jgi:peptide deformylase
MLHLITYPNDILRKKAKPIKFVSDKEKKILNEMADIMISFKGIGLAANQVGLLIRLIVVDTGDTICKIANPEIIEKKGKSDLEEGCLSLPSECVKVKRANEITVQGLDENNREIIVTAKGIYAHVFQHEIDHLDGKLIIDYIQKNSKS